MRKTLFLLSMLALMGLGPAGSARVASAVQLAPADINWEMLDGSTVRFHLRFHNYDPEHESAAVSGTVYSQEAFGVFLPHYGVIGTFNLPPLLPDSFFDVFFDVPLSSLPPSPGLQPSLAVSGALDLICPPPMWVGNVDVTWMEPGGPAQVNKHYGDVGVCPGGPQSCLHVMTGCAQNLTWAIQNVCPGWNVTLVNEDYSPAPALLPPLWSGHICVTAGPNIPVNAVCCFSVDFFCGGSKGTIDVCAYACECPTPVLNGTWGRIKALYR